MKSIGNGWRRAQAAREKVRQADRDLNVLLNNGMYSYGQQSPGGSGMANGAYWGDGMRAMSPEAMKEKAEREAPLMQNKYGGEWVEVSEESVEITPSQLAEMLGKTKPKTLWQRIKRAMRAL